MTESSMCTAGALGQHLYLARIKSGLSLCQAARRLALRPDVVDALERGELRAEAHLLAIAALYGVSLERSQR